MSLPSESKPCHVQCCEVFGEGIWKVALEPERRTIMI